MNCHSQVGGATSKLVEKSSYSIEFPLYKASVSTLPSRVIKFVDFAPKLGRGRHVDVRHQIDLRSSDRQSRILELTPSLDRLGRDRLSLTPTDTKAGEV